ncbi:MAG TPA: hypothetical protein VND19_17605 [Acetobacteraceae bacterium]|nr:hypothetical protein [Acetobacteraceae bacterium]
MIAGFAQATEGEVPMRGKAVAGPGHDRGKKKAEAARIAERFTGMMRLGRFADVYPRQLSGHIVAEERIAPERPRDVSSPEFNAIRRRLAGPLHADHVKEAV